MSESVKNVTVTSVLTIAENVNQVINLSVIAPSAPVAGTITITAITQTASTLGTDLYESPYENGTVDVSDGTVHTFLFPVGTMIEKIKLTPSAEFAFSAKVTTARA